MASLDNFFAVLFRLGIMVIVYYLLFQKFHRDYKKSKKMGFDNKYFKGFTIFFLIMTLFHLLYGLYELYIHSVPNYIDLKTQFSWFNMEDGTVKEIVNNQMRPLYLSIYFFMAIVMAAQIYPLEQANGWKKNPVMKIIIFLASTIWLLFIPAIGNSSLSIVFVLFGFASIGIGLLLNIYINFVLYRKAVGEIKSRALNAAIAFILFTLGVLWSVELGFGAIISDSISNRWDVTIGCLIQIIAAFFYIRAFKTVEFGASEKNQEEIQEKYSLIENFKGKFTRFDIIDWMVIGGILGFVFLGLAWMVYPEENNYNIMKDTISFLGSLDADNNPQGWWLLSITFVIFSIMLIPIAIYRWNRMKLINKPLATMSFIFYLIAAIGLFLLSIFPDNSGDDFFSDLNTGKVHNFVALLAFGGFGLALLIEFVTLVNDGIKTHYVKKKYWLTAYVLFFITVGLTAYTQIKWEIICDSGCWPGDGIYSFPLWEWIVFFVLFFVLYTIILSIPNNIEELKSGAKVNSEKK